MYNLSIVGKKIVKELSALIQEEIIVTNEKGIIKASTVSARIEDFHEGSLMAMQQREILHMKKEQEQTLIGVRSGMVFPIVINDEAIGVIGVTGNPEKIKQYGMLVKKLAEMLISDFQLQQNVANRERFLDDLLHKKMGNEVKLLAQEFAVDLNEKYSIILFNAEEKEGLHFNAATICTPVRPHLFAALVKKSEVESFVAMRQQEKMAIGNAYSIEDVYKSYEEAQHTWLYCTAQRPIIYEQELLIELLISDISREQAEKYTQRLFGPLLMDAELFHHLYLRAMTELSLNEIADQLHIHRNTLNYRFAKIEELTGCKWANPKSRANLYIGCMLVDKFQLL